MKVPDQIEPQVRAVAEFFQDQWFDRTRNVQTAGEVSLQSAGVDEKTSFDSEAYQPARPTHIRRALWDIGIDDVSDYSYVDLGSGKGRSLFVAAERPFRQITGVEFSPRLQELACANIYHFRRWGRGCRKIESVQIDATQFEFPAGRMVLYMFNPFGAATVRQVLEHLQESLERERRHVVIVLLWPQWESEVAAVKGMKLRIKRTEYQIFEANREQIEATLSS